MRECIGNASKVFLANKPVQFVPKEQKIEGTAQNAKMALVQFVTKHIKTSNPLALIKRKGGETHQMTKIDKIVKFVEHEPDEDYLEEKNDVFLTPEQIPPETNRKKK